LFKLTLTAIITIIITGCGYLISNQLNVQNTGSKTKHSNQWNYC